MLLPLSGSRHLYPMSWQRYSTPLFCWAHKKWGGGWNCLWPGWINLIKEFLEFPPPFGKFPPDVEYLWRVTCGGKKKFEGKNCTATAWRGKICRLLYGENGQKHVFVGKYYRKKYSLVLWKKRTKKLYFLVETEQTNVVLFLRESWNRKLWLW